MRIILPQLFCLLVFGAAVAGAQTVPDSEAKIIRLQEFKMPEAAEKAGIDGTVVLNVRVDEKGDVRSAELVAGPSWPCGQDPKRELDDIRAVIKDSLLNAKFTPAIRNGKPKPEDVEVKFFIGQAYRDNVRKRQADEAIKNGKPAPGFINAGILNGRALKLPAPAYPQAAKVAHQSGTVLVEVEIDEQGNVVRAGAVSGYPRLQGEARLAACGAKFSPTILKGNPIRVNGVITYNFLAGGQKVY